MSRTALSLAAALALTVATIPAGAWATMRAQITAADIEAAEFSGVGDLPSGQSALTAKVQILLDRAGISPGVIDGFRGGMSESAIKAFERKSGLPVDGRLDPQVWNLLSSFAAQPLTTDYVVTEEDAQGLVDRIPNDYAEKAQMTSMGYTSIAERIAERFHMDEKFLLQLNPGVEIAPGAVLKVTVPAPPIRAKAARVIIDKETGRVAAYDVRGRMVADYPATVGSAATPSPHGTHKVVAVALDPDYTYNPHKNFKQGNNDRVLRIPPGPNGPVGNVWIDLSKPTYGIHGTPNPSRLFVSQSNGCVRLTNWDARELAGMVQPGATVVEFLAPGVRIADVTGPAPAPALPTGPSAAGTTDAAGAGGAGGTVQQASFSAGKPLPRPARPNQPAAMPEVALAGAATVDPVTGLPLAPEGPLPASPDWAAGTQPAAEAGILADSAAVPPLDPLAVVPAAADPLNEALSAASDGLLQPAPAALPGAGS